MHMTSTIDRFLLDTGDRQIVECILTDDDAMATMRADLVAGLIGERTLVPAAEGHSYWASAEHGALVVTLFGPGRRPMPVVTFGVARDWNAAVLLWETLHRQRGGMPAARYKTNARRMPPAPWVASRLEAGASSTAPADMAWINRFEQAIAWIWMEMGQN